MAWVEVYSGQRSLAFELTTESLDNWLFKKKESVIVAIAGTTKYQNQICILTSIDNRAVTSPG